MLKVRAKRSIIPILLVFAILGSTLMSLGSPGKASANHSAYWNRSGYASVSGWYVGQGYVVWDYWEDGDNWQQYQYFGSCQEYSYYIGISLDMWAPDTVISAYVVFSGPHTATFYFNPG